jgi:Alpha/beta hydrolase domain
MNFEKPVNTGPQHWVRNASVSHLDRWVRDGSRPPESKRLQIADGSFVTDEIGNVLGGIRTPAVDVPTTVLSGLGNGGNPVAFLAGTTLPLGADKLRSLYGSKDDYTEKFAESANAAESAGFVLADDLESMKGIAEALWPS